MKVFLSFAVLVIIVLTQLVTEVKAQRPPFKVRRQYTFEDLGLASGDSPVIFEHGDGDQATYYYDDSYDDEDYDEDGAGFGSGEKESDHQGHEGDNQDHAGDNQGHEGDNQDHGHDGIHLDLETPDGTHVAYKWDGVESPVVIFYNDEPTPGPTTPDPPVTEAPMTPMTTMPTTTPPYPFFPAQPSPILEEKPKVIQVGSKDYGYGRVKVYESVVTYTWSKFFGGSGRERDEENEVGGDGSGEHVHDAPTLYRA